MPRFIPYRRRRAVISLRTIVLCGLLVITPTAAWLTRGEFVEQADAAPRQETTVGPAAGQIRAADIRITDGDTFRVLEERIRIANIDTPEMPGRARCAAEAQLAVQAKARLGQLLSGGDIRLARRGEDRYGRTLARVSVNGVDVGEQLVREGAAQRWAGRKAQWC